MSTAGWILLNLLLDHNNGSLTVLKKYIKYDYIVILAD